MLNSIWALPMKNHLTSSTFTCHLHLQSALCVHHSIGQYCVLHLFCDHFVYTAQLCYLCFLTLVFWISVCPVRRQIWTTGWAQTENVTVTPKQTLQMSLSPQRTQITLHNTWTKLWRACRPGTHCSYTVHHKRRRPAVVVSSCITDGDLWLTVGLTSLCFLRHV